MRLLFILLITVFSLVQSSACTCIYIETFCETVTYNNGGEIQETINLIHGKVLGQESGGINVQVLSIIHGEILENEIFISDALNNFCGQLTADLKVNNEFIFAARTAGNGFSLPVCGVSVLPVLNNRVFGRISVQTNSVSIQNFKKSIGECYNFKFEANVSIFPNPFKNNLSLRIRARANSDDSMQLTIYNVEGRNIYNTTWTDPSSVEETVDLSNFPSGIYFLQFEFKGVVEYKKVVKS